VPDRHQRVYPAYRERLRQEYNCKDPATLWQPKAIHGSGPAMHDQCSNSVRYIGKRTGTRDGNTFTRDTKPSFLQTKFENCYRK
jgi:hypothetical protein